MINKIFKKLYAACLDACFLLGMFTITAGEAPAWALQFKWFIYSAISSLAYQWIEGAPLIQLTRQIKTPEKNYELKS